MSIEAVQNFYQRLSQDESFYAQLRNSSSKNECRAIVETAGYRFTQTELADYTEALLKAKTTEGELNPLAQEELTAVVGGAIALMGREVVMPPYGHVPFEF